MARDLTAFSYLEACNPAQTHHRTQARRPFINEWLQLVYFSSFKTGPRRHAKVVSGGTRGGCIGRRRQQPVGFSKTRLSLVPHSLPLSRRGRRGSAPTSATRTCPWLRYIGPELHPHPAPVACQSCRMLSEDSDGHALQAMRGPERKKNRERCSINRTRSRGNKHSNTTVREKERERERNKDL